MGEYIYSMSSVGFALALLLLLFLNLCSAGQTNNANCDCSILNAERDCDNVPDVGEEEKEEVSATCEYMQSEPAFDGTAKGASYEVRYSVNDDSQGICFAEGTANARVLCLNPGTCAAQETRISKGANACCGECFGEPSSALYIILVIALTVLTVGIVSAICIKSRQAEAPPPLPRNSRRVSMRIEKEADSSASAMERASGRSRTASLRTSNRASVQLQASDVRKNTQNEASARRKKKKGKKSTKRDSFNVLHNNK